MTHQKTSRARVSRTPIKIGHNFFNIATFQVNPKAKVIPSIRSKSVFNAETPHLAHSGLQNFF